MSKVFRVITRILLILMIACGAALFVPPLAGIDTVVVQDGASSNMKRGDVSYVKETTADKLKSGDRIIRVDEDESVNAYRVKKYNAAEKTLTASKSSSAADETLKVNNTVRKILLTVPYLGYISIATQSFTGLMILGGCALIIVILFIIGEVLRKEQQEEEEEEKSGELDEDVSFFSSLNEKKTEPFDAEKAEKEEPDDFPVEGEGEDFVRNLKGAVSGRVNIAEGEGVVNTDSSRNGAAPDEEDQIQTDGLPNVQAALEAALDGRQIEQRKPAASRKAAATTAPKSGEIELAIPILSAEELLAKAKKNGDEPETHTDDVTGICFVDYSECL